MFNSSRLGAANNMDRSRTFSSSIIQGQDHYASMQYGSNPPPMFAASRSLGTPAANMFSSSRTVSMNSVPFATSISGMNMMNSGMVMAPGAQYVMNRNQRPVAPSTVTFEEYKPDISKYGARKTDKYDEIYKKKEVIFKVYKEMNNSADALRGV